MTSWNKPTAEQVEAVIARIQDPSPRAYFFERLKNPLWIEPLYQQGFFRQSQEIVTDPQTGETRFPVSPELRYLARMAANAPCQVTRILLEIPHTDNAMVYYEILDAALNMDGKNAKKLNPKIRAAVSTNSVYLEHKLCELIGHFANDDEFCSALSLARELLRLEPPETIGDDEYSFLRDPKSAIEDYYYKQVLSDIVPRLTKHRPMATLDLLVEILGTIVEHRLERYSSRRYDDGLAIVRQSIELGESDWGSELTHAVITAVRDTSRSIWIHHSSLREDLIQKLEALNWKIGRRLALDVLAYSDVPPLIMISDRLLNRDLFFDRHVYSEYRRLLQAGFSQLQPMQRDQILSWVQEEYEEMSSDESLADKDFALRTAKVRQRHWLSAIAVHLDDSWRSLYEDLCSDEELDSFDDVDPNFGSTSVEWIGPTSPKSSEELLQMDIDELVSFLSSWKPSAGRLANSRRALAREFGQATSNHAHYMSENAFRLKGLDPTYIGEFVSGLQEAVKDGNAIDWESACQLFQWVVSQPREFNTPDAGPDDDRHWGVCRKNIARLFEAGFLADDHAVPIDLRQSAWQLIANILEDPDPTLDHEREYGPPNSDPVMLAINSTRGSALIAVVRYARWVQAAESGGSEHKTGFDIMPEVREVLEKSLDPEFEPTIAVRAVYGLHFSLLCAIDQKWCEKFVDSIFPLSTNNAHLWMSAWQSYLFGNRFHNEVFRLLEHNYRVAIDLLPSSRNDLSRDSSDLSLFQHILILFLHGYSDVDSEQSLIVNLYHKASKQLRKDGNSWLGRALGNGSVDKEILERARVLWEWRSGFAYSDGDESDASELESFGWWVDSGKFDVHWAAENLYEVLKLRSRVEREDSVLEWLAENSRVIPNIAVRSVRILCLEKHRSSWILDSWIEHISSVFRSAFESSDLEAQREARLFGDELVARGVVATDDWWLEQG